MNPMEKNCPYCSKILSSRRGYTDHLKRKHGIQKDPSLFKFSCSVCPYKAETELVLRKHVVVKHAPVQFSCTLCPFKTPFQVKLTIHELQQHKEIQCDQCEFTSRIKTTMKNHKISKHSGYLACEKCAFRASNSLRMSKHRWSKHDEPSYCFICRVEAASFTGLLEHILEEHKKKSYCCPESDCDFVTGKKSEFVSHRVKEHKTSVETETLVQPVTKVTFLTCDQCQFQVSGKRALNKHMKSHRENLEPVFRCTKCEFQATKKRVFTMHLKAHEKKENDPKLQCSECPLKAWSKKELRTHVKATHTAVVSVYSCDKCKYKTKKTLLLEKHRKKHEGGEVKKKRFKGLSEVESMKMEDNSGEHIEVETDQKGEGFKVKSAGDEETESKKESYVCPISSCIFLTPVLSEKIILDHFSISHQDIETKYWNFLTIF